MAESVIKKNAELATKTIHLGTSQTITGAFDLAFTDSTIDIIGVVGWSIGDRSIVTVAGISGIVVSSSHRVDMYGHVDAGKSATVPSTASVTVLYYK